MAKHKGLGRGLDALLAGDVENESNGLRMLPVGQLQPGKYQPRSYMDDDALNTLAESIKSQGIMQPILVRELAPEQYEIIAGERRWRASQIAGLEEVPVLIRDIEDESALQMALIENIQRENLNPLEEALGIKRLIDEFAMTHERAASAVGRSRVAVSNLLRLLTLAPGVQDMLMENKLDMGHARALIGLDAVQQVMLANKVVQEQLSVREVEKLVKKKSKDDEKKTPKTAINPDVAALQSRLSETLGAGVSIAAKSNGSGTLKINYSNLDQLDEIIKKISN
ncbi:MAG TPA: ParB/RepB/Spo0J family partition protein [Methylophilaceae bacterium]|nr:ParB/RepB/Spo0J family partition protein [Methylophilaceae bacterium]